MDDLDPTVSKVVAPECDEISTATHLLAEGELGGRMFADDSMLESLKMMEVMQNNLLCCLLN